MIHIDYIAPETPKADAAAIAALNSQMADVISGREDLQSLAAANPGAFITPTFRRTLLQKGYNRSLIANIAFFTEAISAGSPSSPVAKNRPMVGFTSSAFDSSLYASPAIRKALLQSHNGRCCYCETLLDQAASGVVESFRPQTGYEEGGVLYRPGYYLLAYEPTNTFYACQLCHRFKKDSFPVAGLRYPEVTVEEESPILINPYLDDPRGFIRFNPLNCEAYAFDSVVRFYMDKDGIGPKDTEQKLWSDPTQIPCQRDCSGKPISSPAADVLYEQWLKSSSANEARRGRETIKTLHLNRRLLVRARASQLLNMRGLLSMSSSQGQDATAATAIIKSILSADAPTQLAPEYISASIDGLQSWSHGATAAAGWVGTFANILQHCAKAGNNDVPPLIDDSLIYLVLRQDRQVGVRRIVSLSSADAIYGHLTTERGLAYPIDWRKDLDNNVLVKSATGEWRTSLRGILSLPPHKRARLFVENHLWAVGQFLPAQN